MIDMLELFGAKKHQAWVVGARFLSVLDDFLYSIKKFWSNLGNTLFKLCGD